jgi:hypothetical protein
MSVKTFLGEDVDVIRSKFGKLEKRGGGGGRCEWKRFEDLNYFEDSGKAEHTGEWEDKFKMVFLVDLKVRLRVLC